MLAIVVVSGINSFQNWSKDREFASLNMFKENVPLKVLRPAGAAGSEVVSVKKNELAVGDVVVLEVGDRLPADGLLTAGLRVEVDQSAHTGESEAVDKAPGGGIELARLIGGSTVRAGSGMRMLVTAVGEHTEIGKIVKDVQQDDDEGTPLQQKLTKLADDIGKVGMAVGVLTFAVLTALFLWQNPFFPAHAHPSARDVFDS